MSSHKKKKPNQWLVRFSENLLASSNLKTLCDAINEWEPVSVSHDIGKECICGKKIDNQYVIKNLNNDSELIVGSSCVRKFSGENDALWKKLKTVIYNEKSITSGDKKRKCMDCNEKYNLENNKKYFHIFRCQQCSILKKMKTPCREHGILGICYSCERAENSGKKLKSDFWYPMSS